MLGLVNFHDYFARHQGLLLSHLCIHYTSAAQNEIVNAYCKFGHSGSVGIRNCVNGTSDLFQISGCDIWEKMLNKVRSITDSSYLKIS